MTTPAQRLAESGLVLPPTAVPAGAYVPARQAGGLVFTAGQLPFADGSLAATGKVGAEVEAADARALARVAALNALAAIADLLLGPEHHDRAEALNRVAGVVKLTGFVASAPGFTGQPGVVDGASELLGKVFGEAGRHARSAVGVAVLPLDAPVEVELTVAVH